MAPNVRDSPIFIIEQRGAAEVAFHAIDGTIDSIIITVFSHSNSDPYEETAEEQRHFEYNFMCSPGRGLRPVNNGFVSVRWVSLHPGMDVSQSF